MLQPVPGEHILMFSRLCEQENEATYDFARSVATNDRIIDEQHYLAFEFGLDGRQLSSNTLLSCLLTRLEGIEISCAFKNGWGEQR